MSTVLQDEQWSLDDFTFGEGFDVFVSGDGGGLDLGSPEIVTQDSPRALANGTDFGRDFIHGPEMQFTLTAYKSGSDRDAQGAESIWPAVRQLAQVWRASIKKSQKNPAWVSTLRWGRAGETLRATGRARKFDVVMGDQKDNHYAKITATFQRDRADWLLEPTGDGSANRLDLSLTPPPEDGGLVWSDDLIWPMVFTSPVQARAGTINVDSYDDCSFKLQVWGPSAGGYMDGFRVSGPGWVLDSSARIAYDQSAIIDTFAMTALRGSTSIADTLTLDSALDAQLQPGVQVITFSAGDVTGSARAAITWYDTVSA